MNNKEILLVDYKANNKDEKTLKGGTHKKEKIGRNDPCPCGSGKKYKQCCGK